MEKGVSVPFPVARPLSQLSRKKSLTLIVSISPSINLSKRSITLGSCLRFLKYMIPQPIKAHNISATQFNSILITGTLSSRNPQTVQYLNWCISQLLNPSTAQFPTAQSLNCLISQLFNPSASRPLNPSVFQYLNLSNIPIPQALY